MRSRPRRPCPRPPTTCPRTPRSKAWTPPRPWRPPSSAACPCSSAGATATTSSSTAWSTTARASSTWGLATSCFFLPSSPTSWTESSIPHPSRRSACRPACSSRSLPPRSTTRLATRARRASRSSWRCPRGRTLRRRGSRPAAATPSCSGRRTNGCSRTPRAPRPLPAPLSA